MVLYKYVGIAAAIKITASQTLGFSRFENFNDPFETASSFSPDQYELFTNQTVSDLYSNYVASCLTRSNLNSLMWSHYADHHKGVVVGYNVSNNDELRSLDKNVIPVQFGSVIYSRTKPIKSIEKVDLGYSFSPEKLEVLQNTFLMKADSWAYEEEVRIVRSLCNSNALIGEQDLFDSPKMVEVSGANLFLVQLPRGSITEIILGCRVDETSDDCMEIYNNISKYKHPVKVSKCYVSATTWDLHLKEVPQSFD